MYDQEFWGSKNVIVTGGSGFLGAHVVRELEKAGAKYIFPVSRQTGIDLTNYGDALRLPFLPVGHDGEEQDLIIHLAANVGGIAYNMENPASLIADNLRMGINVLEAAREASYRLHKIVMLGTTCSYPANAPVPTPESSLWDGRPEASNAAYGVAKRAIHMAANAYRLQHGMNTITLLPTNLYGEYDTFDPNRSHVIPAILKKMHEAKRDGKDRIELFSDGRPTRDFLYAGNAAQAILLAAENFNGHWPINLGSGREISIRELANLCMYVTGWDGEIDWLGVKSGTLRRCLDTSAAKEYLGWQAQTSLVDGLRATYEWWISSI